MLSWLLTPHADCAACSTRRWWSSWFGWYQVSKRVSFGCHFTLLHTAGVLLAPDMWYGHIPLCWHLRFYIFYCSYFIYYFYLQQYISYANYHTTSHPLFDIVFAFFFFAQLNLLVSQVQWFSAWLSCHRRSSSRWSSSVAMRTTSWKCWLSWVSVLGVGQLSDLLMTLHCSIMYPYMHIALLAVERIQHWYDIIHVAMLSLLYILVMYASSSVSICPGINLSGAVFATFYCYELSRVEGTSRSSAFSWRLSSWSSHNITSSNQEFESSQGRESSFSGASLPMASLQDSKA